MNPSPKWGGGFAIYLGASDQSESTDAKRKIGSRTSAGEITDRERSLGECQSGRATAEGG